MPRASEEEIISRSLLHVCLWIRRPRKPKPHVCELCERFSVRWASKSFRKRSGESRYVRLTVERSQKGVAIEYNTKKVPRKLSSHGWRKLWRKTIGVYRFRRPVLNATWVRLGLTWKYLGLPLKRAARRSEIFGPAQWLFAEIFMWSFPLQDAQLSFYGQNGWWSYSRVSPLVFLHGRFSELSSVCSRFWNETTCILPPVKATPEGLLIVRYWDPRFPWKFSKRRICKLHLSCWEPFHRYIIGFSPR